MRASVMLFLPALTLGGTLSPLTVQLAQSGLSIRGIWGEGTGAAGYLYQISNRVTLGLTEEELIRMLQETATALCEQERRARASIKGEALDNLTDKIWRSLGILKFARKLPLGEFMNLLSDVRLGVAMGILDHIQLHQLTALFIEAMPATLTLAAEYTHASDREMDLARGALVRSRLGAG